MTFGFVPTGNVPADLARMRAAGATPLQVATYMDEYGRSHDFAADTPDNAFLESLQARQKPDTAFYEVGDKKLPAPVWEKASPREQFDTLKQAGQIPRDARFVEEGGKWGYTTPDNDAPRSAIPRDLLETYNRNAPRYAEKGKNPPSHYGVEERGKVSVTAYTEPDKTVTYNEPDGTHLMFRYQGGKAVVASLKDADGKVILEANEDGAFDTADVAAAIGAGKLTRAGAEDLLGKEAVEKVGTAPPTEPASSPIRGGHEVTDLDEYKTGSGYDLKRYSRENPNGYKRLLSEGFAPEDVVAAQTQGRPETYQRLVATANMELANARILTAAEKQEARQAQGKSQTSAALSGVGQLGDYAASMLVPFYWLKDTKAKKNPTAMDQFMGRDRDMKGWEVAVNVGVDALLVVPVLGKVAKAMKVVAPQTQRLARMGEVAAKDAKAASVARNVMTTTSPAAREYADAAATAQKLDRAAMSSRQAFIEGIASKAKTRTTVVRTAGGLPIGYADVTKSSDPLMRLNKNQLRFIERKARLPGFQGAVLEYQQANKVLTKAGKQSSVALKLGKMQRSTTPLVTQEERMLRASQLFERQAAAESRYAASLDQLNGMLTPRANSMRATVAPLTSRINTLPDRTAQTLALYDYLKGVSGDRRIYGFDAGDYSTEAYPAPHKNTGLTRAELENPAHWHDIEQSTTMRTTGTSVNRYDVAANRRGGQFMAKTEPDASSRQAIATVSKPPSLPGGGVDTREASAATMTPAQLAHQTGTTDTTPAVGRPVSAPRVRTPATRQPQRAPVKQPARQPQRVTRETPGVEPSRVAAPSREPETRTPTVGAPHTAAAPNVRKAPAPVTTPNATPSNAPAGASARSPAPAPHPHPQPRPHPRPQPTPIPVDKPPVRPPEKQDIRTPFRPQPPEDKRKDKAFEPTAKDFENATALRSGFIWWLRFKNGKLRAYRTLPKGVKNVAGGKGSGYRSVQTVEGKPINTRIKLGVFMADILKPARQPGRAGAVRYNPVPHMVKPHHTRRGTGVTRRSDR